MDYVTITDVELLKTGTWNASTGTITITQDIITQIHQAWAAEALPLPVIKIGHTDPRFENPDWDGDPAYGQVDNLKISEDGNTLTGDYVNVPKDLAEKIPSAYPQRSVELDEVELKDTEGEVLASFPWVLTGLALLGKSAPAVKGLGDVHAAFSARLKGATVHTKRTLVLSAALSFPGGHTDQSLRQALRDAVQNANPAADFCWVEDFDDEQVWFEIETPGADPAFSTWQQGYTAAENGAITLTGAPVRVQVKRTYEPVPETQPSQEAPVPHEPIAARDGSGMGAEEASSPTKGEHEMFTPEQLKVLAAQFGLPEDATEDQVMAAINGQPSESTEPSAEETGGEGSEGGQETPAEEPQEPVQEPQPVAASAPQTVTLSQATFSQMQTTIQKQGAQLAELTAKSDHDRRYKEVEKAVNNGQIHASDANSWMEQMAINEQSTTKLLRGLSQVIPTREIGHDLAGNYLNSQDVISEEAQNLDDAIFSKEGK